MPTNKRIYKNCFLHILYNDIRVGCKKNIPIYVVTLLYTLITSYSFYKLMSRSFQRGDINVIPGALDYIVYFFGGMKCIDSNATFEIPINWMTIQVLVIGCVSIYPVNDLYGGGCIILLQFGSRMKWWISKCLWSILQVFILYFIFFSGMIICCIFFGGDWNYHTQIAVKMASVTIANSKFLIIVIAISPIVYSIIAAIVQINLSLVVGPINSFACMVAYHILSIYCSNSFLLGNYSMIYRIKNLTGEGVDWQTGLVLCSFIFIIVMILGTWRFCKSDIIGKKS